MNIVYRLVWSHVTNGLVPVPEIAKKCKKSQRGHSAIILLSTLILGLCNSITANAVDVNWSDAYPTYIFPNNQGINYDSVLNTGVAFTLDNQSLPNHFAAGSTLNILGPLPLIASGVNGNATSVSVLDALPGGSNPGRITVITATDAQGNTTPITADNISQYTYSPSPANPQQNQELNVEIPGLEGSYQIINTYDSSTFVSADDTPVSNLLLPVYVPTSFRIYNNLGIAAIAATGGTANINIGADTAGTTPIAAAANTLELLAKNTQLAKADGSAAARLTGYLIIIFISAQLRLFPAIAKTSVRRAHNIISR
jgi:fibronectin-binding autotransporter adhesin